MGRAARVRERWWMCLRMFWGVGRNDSIVHWGSSVGCWTCGIGPGWKRGLESEHHKSELKPHHSSYFEDIGLTKPSEARWRRHAGQTGKSMRDVIGNIKPAKVWDQGGHCNYQEIHIRLRPILPPHMSVSWHFFYPVRNVECICSPFHMTIEKKAGLTLCLCAIHRNSRKSLLRRLNTHRENHINHQPRKLEHSTKPLL